MMKKERWEVCINRDLSKGINYQFYIYRSGFRPSEIRYTRQGKSHITNIIMEELPNDVCCPVSPISMPEDFCQQLIDELQNEIEAIKKHLKEEREMRKEMFDILLDEKKQSLKSKPDPELKSDTSDMR
jgi:hypothetical protein